MADKDATTPSERSPVGNPAKPSEHVRSAHFIGWIAMVVGMFMAILDIQIVASSLTDIQVGLSASPDEISWVQTSYLIAEIVMIPLSGFLSRLISTRWLFVVSTIGFTAMSFLCAISWSIESMIWFRVLQGFIGGAMIPTVFATTFIVFPRSQQNAASVTIGLIATMAPTVGPTLGGYLTSAFSWHWLFMVNVIPGLLVASVVALTMDIDRGDRSLLAGFDFSGLASMAAFLGSLEYILEEGPRHDWFDEQTIQYGAVICLLSGLFFFWRMFTYKKPIVDIVAFGNLNFAIGSLFSFVLGMGLYGTVYSLPLMLSRVRGYDSLQIGVIMAVSGVFQFMSAPISGMLMRVISQRILLGLGLALFAVGVWLNGFLNSDVSFNELFVPQALRGFAVMFCMIPITNLAMGTLPHDKLKNAAGLFNLMRNLGGAICLAGINTMLYERGTLYFGRLGEFINPASNVYHHWLDTLTARYSALGIAEPVQAAMSSIIGIVRREATVMSFNDVHIAIGVIFLLSMVFLPLVQAPKPGAPSGGGH